MKTEIFEWAYQRHWTLKDLAARLGYSEEHLSRLRSGKLPISEQFRDRCIAMLGPDVSSLFLPDVSAETSSGALPRGPS